MSGLKNYGLRLKSFAKNIIAFVKSVGTSMMQKIKNWLKTLFTEEYEVVIWYDPAKRQVYKMKSIQKLNQNNLVGVLVTGEKFTMQTQEPFNYQVRKIH